MLRSMITGGLSPCIVQPKVTLSINHSAQPAFNGLTFL